MSPNATIEVIAPTRGRPVRAAVMAASWDQTRESVHTRLTLALDVEDPHLPEYRGLALGKVWNTIEVGPGDMVQRTNEAVRHISADIYGWAADDNVFLTNGWDEAVREAFCDPTITTVNTNDLLVGDEKGGVYFVRGSAVKALGWFLPPFLSHLYVDFAITALAKRAGTYLYLPEVIIEHRHPYAGKAQWDDLYLSVNNQKQDERDREAFYQWWNGEGAANDAEVLRACTIA